MKKYLLSVAAIVMLAGFSFSQTKIESGKSSDKKLKEYDEIIIKRKGKDKDKSDKVVVEIKDDEVFVNGTPLEDFVNDDISIQLRTPRRYHLNVSPFVHGGTWSPDNNFNFNSDEGPEKAFLGVSTEGSASGAKLIEISENSPAEKAGLKKDDYITKIDDKEIFDHEQLVEAISAHKPGDKVTVQYTRNSKKMKADIALAGKRSSNIIYGPDGPTPPSPPTEPMPPNEDMNFDWDNDNNFNHVFKFKMKPRLGIKAQDTEDGNGVTVLDVDGDSPADKAGLKEDDIITSFDGKAVSSVEDLARLSKEANDKSTLKLEVKRKGKTENIEIKIPKKLKTTNL